MRRFLNRWRKTLFSTFRKHFEALNATICWSVLHKLLTIQKFGITAFTGKQINVTRPKLIENERNEVLKNFHFFQKNPFFFKFWKSPEKIDSTSKLYTIVANHFLKILKVSLESWDFTLNDSVTLNATILLYAKSSHLEAKRSQFSAWKRGIWYFENWKSSHLKTEDVIINLKCGTHKEYLKHIAPLISWHSLHYWLLNATIFSISWWFLRFKNLHLCVFYEWKSTIEVSNRRN